MEAAKMDGSRFRTAFVLLLVVGISLLFLSVIGPFLQTLLFGAIFAGLLQPLYRWLVKRTRGRTALAAALTLVAAFFLIVGPVSALVGIVVQQAVEVGEKAVPWIQENLARGSEFDAHDWLVQRAPFAADFVPSHRQIVEQATGVAKTAGSYLASNASKLGAGTAGFLLHFFVMLYAMFFFLKDGRRMLEKILYFMPLSHEDEVRMLQRFSSVTKATVKGTLLIGLIQGGLAGVAFGVAGIGGAAFWGTVMVVLSIVPGVGAALVWVPAVIYLFTTGQVLTAILLAVWCAAVVGTIDNILRPILVGRDAKMPDLMIMISTLGGLFYFGPLGFIVGPIVAGLFMTVWDIYGVAFRDILPPVKSLRDLSAATETPPSEGNPAAKG